VESGSRGVHEKASICVVRQAESHRSNGFLQVSMPELQKPLVTALALKWWDEEYA
jgi:hypothetical protein